jgi:hypothetical protein
MKRTLIWAVALLSVSLVAQAGLEKERKWEKTYSINSDAKLDLASSFGDVEMEVWDRNEISVEITFIVEGKKEEDVMEALEKCKVEASGTSSLVKIATSTGDWGRKIDRIETNIIIKAPSTIAFDLKHRFGDASLPAMEGPVRLDIQHGDVRMEGMKHKNNKIDLAFGDAIFGTIGGAQMDIKHSDVKISSAGRVNIDNQFSDIKIKEIAEVLYLDCQHGDIEVLEFSSDLKEIKVDIQFGDLNIALSESSNWKLEADMSFSDLSLPSGVKKRKSEEKDWSNNYEVQAFHGDASEVNISIDAQHSDVNISFF